MRKTMLFAFVAFLVTPAFSQSTCSGNGSINFQRWNNISGTSITSLTSLSSFPDNPSQSGSRTLFEMPNNIGNNIGIRMHGFICAPSSGTYFFWIASDASGELWLSTNSSTTNKRRIAFHTGTTNSRQWNKYSTQKSAAVSLVAGELYYVEALMKESTGGDNLAVGWSKPGQSTNSPSEVIPGANLLPQLPVIDLTPPTPPTQLRTSGISQHSITLAWTASTDNIQVTGYDVYYSNGVKINQTNITSTNFNVINLAPGTGYSFYVKARDAAGNESAPSSTITASTYIAGAANENFSQRTVISNQRMPHDLVYGPDNKLWYTERFAGRVSFVAPESGIKTTVLSLGSKMVRAGGQDGLMGLALHPDFINGKPYVYISYTYQSLSATVRRTRIERYTYDPGTLSLIEPVTILENIPGSNDHNSARLAIGPDQKLYYSVGDMGAGQFDNISRVNNSQNLTINEGKILRLNTEIENGSWVPTDNPFTSSGITLPVYSLGHRNPQGLVWGNVNGIPILYSTEHGPFSDDEINIIQSGRNYGWPNVIGFCDGNYNNRTTGGFTITNEQNNCTSLNVVEPIRSLFPVSNPPSSGDNMQWPSTAPSGMDFYGHSIIPGWQNSILVANLKKGTVSRFKLSSDGNFIISDTLHYFRGLGRFRDVAISPDGMKIYVACDSSGSTSGPTGNVTTTPANPGSILEFTYQPVTPRASETLFTKASASNNVQIDIYPNPASAHFIIYNYYQKAKAAELIDLNGKTIRKVILSQTSTIISSRELPNGMYALRIFDAANKLLKTEKIIVQH